MLASSAFVGAGGVLVACGSDDDSDGGSTDPTASEGGAPTSEGGGGEALVALGDVPVGGAIVVAGGPDGNVVVAQPSEGEVVAFTAKCTHKGGTVAVVGDKLQCPLHGSQFNFDTGEVLHDPATQPLPKVDVKVDGDEVVSS